MRPGVTGFVSSISSYVIKYFVSGAQRRRRHGKSRRRMRGHRPIRVPQQDLPCFEPHPCRTQAPAEGVLEVVPPDLGEPRGRLSPYLFSVPGGRPGPCSTPPAVVQPVEGGVLDPRRGKHEPLVLAASPPDHRPRYAVHHDQPILAVLHAAGSIPAAPWRNNPPRVQAGGRFCGQPEVIKPAINQEIWTRRLNAL